MRALNGKDWWWYHPLVDVFVGIFDRLGVIAAVVERRQKVRKGDIPKPLPRPWDKQKHTKKIGNKPRPLDEMRRMLGWD